MSKCHVSVILMIGVAFPAVAQGFKAGAWMVGSGQGLVEYTVGSGSGNVFRITCDVGYTLEAETTSITFTIRDRDPPPNSTIRVTLKGNEFKFRVGQYGGIALDDKANHVNFTGLWRKMVTGARSIHVKFADGSASSFLIHGAREALGLKPCDDAFTGDTSKAVRRKSR